MKLISEKFNKIKDFIKSIDLKSGDKSLENSESATILLTSDENSNAQIFNVVGRYDDRPSLNRDSSTILLGESGNIDKDFIRNGQNNLNEDNGSYIAANTDKIRLNSKQGSIEISSNKHINITGKNNIFIISGDDLIMKIEGKISVKSKDDIDLESSKNINLKCKKFEIDAQQINLGKNATNPAVLGTKFSTDYNVHTHLSTTPGSPTSPKTSQVSFLSSKVKLG